MDQSAGRPGWALALCDLFATGHAPEVASGRALWSRVERLLRRTTESERAVDALACLASLNGASAEDLARIAPLVGLAPASAAALMERLAHNGLVEYRRNSYGTSRWHLQPALRPPLVARWFFTEPPSRPWQTLAEAFTERELDLINAAIAAAEAGSIQARLAAESWADSLPPSTQWSSATIETVARYGGLDETAVRFAVSGARDLVTYVQTASTQANAVMSGAFHGALAILERPLRMWLDPEAVHAMLDLAVLDRRARSNTPEHPLRILSELAAHIDPDFGTIIEVRGRLLDAALMWLRQDQSARRWEAVTEVLAGILSPEAMGTWIDPGDPNKFTVAQGIETPANLRETIRLWSSVDSALTADRQLEAPLCTPGALVNLLEIAIEWLRIGCGRAPGSTPPTIKQQRLGMVGARIMLASLHPSIQDTPGLALRADEMLEGVYKYAEPMGGAPEGFTVDDDLRTVVGGYRYWSAEDASAELDDQNAAINELAQRLVSMGPQAGGVRFEELARQARIASKNPEIARVSEAMRPLLDDPQSWYNAASDPSLVEAALRQWLVVSPGTIPSDLVTTLLSDPAYRRAVVMATLGRRTVDDVTKTVVAALGAGDTWGLYLELIRSEADEVLHLLLAHPVAVVSSTAVLAFAVGQPYGRPLPDVWTPRWREAVVRLRAEELDNNSHWQISLLLKHLALNDPDLFEQWFTARLEVNSFIHDPDPTGCEHYLALLPRAHRERLAAYCVAKPRIGQSLLTPLLGADANLASSLLDEGTVTVEQLLPAIQGQRNRNLETLAPVLLKHGAAAEVVAAAAGELHSGWGEDWDRHEEALNYFRGLAERMPVLRPVAEAGCEQQEELRDKARRNTGSLEP